MFRGKFEFEREVIAPRSWLVVCVRLIGSWTPFISCFTLSFEPLLLFARLRDVLGGLKAVVFEVW